MHFDFALELLERGLEIGPLNLRGLQRKGICLQRLALAGAQGHSLERAREHYRSVLSTFDDDVETLALLGRVDKDAGAAAWRQPGATPDKMREEAAWESALLRGAIDSYSKGYRHDPRHYYSGINALTQGACGGDLLFTEACLKRGVQVHWLQPFAEPEFIERSVVRGGQAWRQRYLDARAGLTAPRRAGRSRPAAPRLSGWLCLRALQPVVAL